MREVENHRASSRDPLCDMNEHTSEDNPATKSTGQMELEGTQIVTETNDCVCVCGKMINASVCIFLINADCSCNADVHMD